jgi:hypothetical protein
MNVQEKKMETIQYDIMKDLDEHTKNMVINALNAIKKYNLEEFVRDFNGENGFAFSNDKRINKIGNELLEDGHSGCSFAITMRFCQNILQKQYDFINKKNDENKKEEEIIKGSGKIFETYNLMDEDNKEAADIWASKGVDAAVNHMLSDLNSGKCDYASMRARFG